MPVKEAVIKPVEEDEDDVEDIDADDDIVALDDDDENDDNKADETLTIDSDPDDLDDPEDEPEEAQTEFEPRIHREMDRKVREEQEAQAAA